MHIYFIKFRANLQLNFAEWELRLRKSIKRYEKNSLRNTIKNSFEKTLEIQ
jgi:hypothetical protein